MSDFELSLGADTSGLERGETALDKVGDKAERTERRTKSAMGGMSTSFAKMATSVLGVIGVLETLRRVSSASIVQARAFGAAVGEVSTLLDGGAAQMSALEESARKLGVTYGTGATPQVQAFYQAISAGASTVEEASSILDTANRLAIGGVTDVTTAVDILTSAVNIYSASGLTAAEASDALFVAMKAGKTTVGELSASLGKVLPLAEKMGLTFDDTAAAVAALTKGGISTAESVTGLRAALSAILGTSTEAQKLAAQLGIDFNVAGLKAQGFAGFMQEVVAKTGGSAESMRTLFSSIEAVNAVLALSGPAGASMNAILDDMKNKAGATTEAYDKLASSFDQRLKRAIAAVTDVGVTLGNALLTVLVPALEAVASVVSGVVGAFSELHDFLDGTTRAEKIRETAIDNVSIALGDQVNAMRVLSASIKDGTYLSLDMAQTKLAEAEAHREVVNQLIAQRQEAELAASGYYSLLEQIGQVRKGLDAMRTPGDDLEQMPIKMRDAYESLEQTLANMLVKQHDMLASVRSGNQLREDEQAHLDAINSAIENLRGRIAELKGDTGDNVTLTKRLSDVAASVSFNNAIDGAEKLAERLGVSVSLARQIAAAAGSSNVGSEVFDPRSDKYNPAAAAQAERDAALAKIRDSFENPLPAIKFSGGGGRGGRASSEVDSVQKVIDSLKAEVEAIGQSETARKTMQAVQQAGVDLYSVEGQQIADLVEQIERTTKSQEAATERTKLFKDSIMDAAMGGVDSFDQLADAIKRAALEYLLFGQGMFATGDNSGFGGILGGLVSAISGIPANASGTDNFQGGLTSVNERGGEIMNLPQGTQVIPHDISKRMADNAKSGTVVQVNNYSNGDVRTEESQSPDGRKMLKVFIGEEIGKGGFDGQLRSRYGSGVKTVKR